MEGWNDGILECWRNLVTSYEFRVDPLRLTPHDSRKKWR